MITEHPIYVTADRKRIVPESDPEAAFLLVGAGCVLSPAIARQYGIPFDDPAPPPAPLDEDDIHVPQGHVDPSIRSFVERVRDAAGEWFAAMEEQLAALEARIAALESRNSEAPCYRIIEADGTLGPASREPIQGEALKQPESPVEGESVEGESTEAKSLSAPPETKHVPSPEATKSEGSPEPASGLTIQRPPKGKR